MKTKFILLALMLLFLVSQQVAFLVNAEESCTSAAAQSNSAQCNSGLSNSTHCACSHCGCQCQCEKVCRLVKEEKKVAIVCWSCKCEEFCLPGHSERGCLNCEEVCSDCSCDPKTPHAAPKAFKWYDWCPSNCGDIFTKTKLMKKTVTKTVPSYKWVVEDACPRCASQCQSVAAENGAAIPPPPKNARAAATNSAMR